MIASWMLYALAVGALATLAGVVLERALVARRWPRRFVWAAMLLLSLAWPLANAVRRLASVRMPAMTVLPFTVTVQSPVVVRPSSADRAALVDRTLLGVWLLWSTVLLAQLVAGIVTLRRTRRTWHAHELDGRTVRLSDNVGPAVIGLRSMDVVVPEWIVTLDEPLRAIVLRHEEEHRTARDPYLLFGAAVALALMPWNVALWLQARRLRLAIEVDCDARVLRVHPSPERYGMLMLTIAQRRSIAPVLFAPMLSEPTTQLERRIMAMQTTTRRLARITMLGGGAVGLAVLAFACSLQSDNPLSPKPSSGARPTRVTDNQTFFEFQVEKPVAPAPGNPAPRYPDLLRQSGIEGEVLAQFVVDTAGRPDMMTFKVLRSTHDLFTATVRASLPNMKFEPALVGGRKVKQLVQMPFQFSLSKQSAGPTPVVVTATTLPPGDAPAAPHVLKLAPARTLVPGEAPAHVDREASLRPGNRAPLYPAQLRAEQIEGEVLARFLVDEDGTPDMSTFTIVRSTHDLFSAAVKEGVGQMRFDPAQLNGKPVKSVIVMPFTFNLAK